jgi:predicted amidohydrolase YtcJ
MTTLFKNGKIFPGDGQGGDANAHLCMIVRDELIEYVGQNNDGALPSTGKQPTHIVDLHGRMVVPGFIDGHMHLLHFGSALQKIDLTPCKNLEDIRDTIRSAAQANPQAPRILCRGWMHSMTEGQALASMVDDLDDRPIFIDSKDLHSTWCNTAALAELAVQNMPNPAGGEIHRDKSGKATGLLSEAATVTLVWPHLAKVASTDEKLNSIRQAVRTYSAAGYTGMIDMAMDENAWEALKELKSKEELAIRIAAYWIITPSNTDDENMAQVDRAIALHKEFNLENSPDFRIAGIKIISDGVVDACTAALCEPYSSNGVSCDPLWDAEALKRVVQKADTAGLQCALHAIGDAAVKLAIDTLESVGTPGRRHRIEHLEVTSPGDAKRLSDLGITASVQAVHADPAILRAWPKLMGRERYGRAFAYREFLDRGAHLALGTDAPTAPHMPLANLYVATTRRSAKEPSLTDTVNEHFVLPLASAVSAATAGSAYSCFADRRVGTLEAGKKADFVVLDMQWKPEKLLEAAVIETWFGGKKVWERTL